MPICLKCNNKFAAWVKINGDFKNLSTRKYCLDCSPYKGHNTKRIHLIIHPDYKICPDCKQLKSLNDFYVHDREGHLKHSYCKECCGKRTLKRQIKLKKEAVEYKGGCCCVCGYNKYLGALDFHHKDPSQKEFDISRVRKLKFELVKTELDKCVCVCKNCHAEIHAGLIDITNLK